MLPVQQGLRGNKTSASEEKWPPFNFFSVQGKVVDRRGHIRRIGCVIRTLEAQVGQFLVGCKCPVSRSIVVQEQDPLVTFPRSSTIVVAGGFQSLRDSLFIVTLNLSECRNLSQTSAIEKYACYWT